ncbi:MAG: dienelactone hydrolase family protein [Halobacteria archaeon]|nr:dienelactone hydrolase family protein [Halobacteria archaeon]
MDHNPESNDDLSLVYKSVPPSETTEDEAPAVILLHGRGTDETDLLPIGDQLPDELHILSVRAPQSFQRGYVWYDLDLSGGGLHESQPDPEGFRRSLDLLHDFVVEATEKYGLDENRIGLLGFSQGGIIGLSALLEKPERYAWVVALHSYLPDSHSKLERFENTQGKPVFIATGENDRIIPVDRGRTAAEILREGGLNVDFNVYGSGHGVTRDELRDVVEWVRVRL